MAEMQRLYTTIDALVLHLSTGAKPGALYDATMAANTTNFLWQAVREASAMVTSRVSRVFTPYQRTYSVGIDSLYDLRLLKLPDTALEIINVTGDGSPTVVLNDTATSFLLRTDADWNFSDLYSRVEITGIFGFHDDYDNAWIALEESASLLQTDNTLNVADASAYAVGDILRIGDELAIVQSKNDVSNELTLMRGVNGTTAVTHSAKPLKVYRQMQDVYEVTREIAAYLYKMRHKVGEVFATAGGTVQVGALSPDIWTVLDRYHPEARNEDVYR